MPNNKNHLHNVFFGLKDNSPELISKLIRDCYTYLQPEDGILFFSAGSRAEGFERDVNDTAFHVALTVLFKDSEAHDAYQVSRQHNIFIDRNKDNWAGARVFDSNITAD